MTEAKNTKLIQLTQGKFAIVDAEDFGWISQCRWHAARHGNTFYASTSIKVDNKFKLYRMHRLINDTQHGLETDHIDGNGLNNTRSNLRTATAMQNQQNVKRSCGRKNGFRGVFFSKTMKKWNASITINKKRISLGWFDDEIEAANAYKSRSLMEFGSFSPF